LRLKARNTSTKAAPRRFDGLRAIALFKFGKALLLIATSYGLRKLLNPDVIVRLNTWTVSLTDGFMRNLLIRALAWLNNLGAAKLNLVIAVSLGYTVLVTTEGLGLWFRRHWGEWLTLIATASLLPFELWDLTRARHKAGVWLALAVNLVIVGYLVAQLEKNAKARARG
jgi:uncharacterized membrane protein (DUF2068 family)